MYNYGKELIRRESNEFDWQQVTFSAKDIWKIIKNLNTIKVHGHVNISVPICGDIVCLLIDMIFKKYDRYDLFFPIIMIVHKN